MEKVSHTSLIDSVRIYLSLTKPGIVLGNAITAAGGFALASKGQMPFTVFLATIIGLSFIIASACVCNNYIDKDYDQKMTRTKKRALVVGLVTGQNALLFAMLLGVIGTLFLISFTHFLVVSIALFGFFVYVLLYSFLKHRSTQGILIGSIAGAVPPVVGYTAVTHRLDIAALLLFLIVALWQMPHFLSIAIYRLEDYKAASIPVLPLKKGIHKTKIQMLFYIVAFVLVSCLLTGFGYTDYTFLAVTVLLGGIWFWLCSKGFKSTDDKKWARKMFFFSLLMIMAQSAMIPLSVI